LHNFFPTHFHFLLLLFSYVVSIKIVTPHSLLSRKMSKT
jgi:hypothetical protein